MTSIMGKAWLPALAALAVFAMFAFGSQTRSAEADVIDVEIVDATFFNNDDDCDETFFDEIGDYDEGNPFTVPVGTGVAICVEVDSNDPGDVISADSDEYGNWTEAICGGEDGDSDDFEIPEDECETVGITNDDIEIPCGGDGDDDSALSTCESDGDGDVLLFWACEDEAGLTEITISQTDGDDDGIDVFSFWVFCAAEPDEATVTTTSPGVHLL